MLSAYVTVDSMFPVYEGYYLFDNSNVKITDPGAVIWPALMEKAYAQWAATGNNASVAPGDDKNNYKVINGGYEDTVYNQILGVTTYVDTSTTGSTPVFPHVPAAFTDGPDVGFATDSNPALAELVGGHAYAMVGYDATAQTVTLFNPWGLAGGTEAGQFKPGLVTLSMSQVLANYSDYYHNPQATAGSTS